MPQFIHLTDDRDKALLRERGIIGARLRDGKLKGFFAVPVLQNYYLSHQWLRELKRRGIKAISAVQFRVEDQRPVSVGRYNQEHIETTAAEAVRIFREHVSGLGLEVIFRGSLDPRDIARIYTPRQVTGWRYYPESHGDGRKPCGCSYCQRGQIKNRKLREEYGWD